MAAAARRHHEAALAGLAFVASFIAACGPKAAPVPRGPCPDDMAWVSGLGAMGAPGSFCIDRFEAALEARDGQLHSPYEPVGKAEVRAVSRAGIVPQAYISRAEAARAWEASGKRLCREDEWVHACAGSMRAHFPYGDRHEERACNDHGRSPHKVVHPQLGDSIYSSASAMNDPRLNQVPETVAPTGRFERCKTHDGVYDLVGNLHEWVSTPAASRSHRGVFRGGYYLDTDKNGVGCRYRTDAHAPEYHDYSTGFRCCRDAR